MTKAKSAAIGKQEARDAGADLLLEKADIQRLSQVLHDGEWYADERMRAWRAYRAMPMPTLEDEAWRRTDIRALRWNEVVPDTLLGNVSRSGSNGRVPARFKKPLVSRKQGGQIIVANGQIVERTLDDEAAEQGVLFTDLLAATRTHPGQVARHIGKLVPSREGKHAAMAAALTDQGVFVLVPAGVVLERPLHSVLWANGLAQFSRVVVIVEQGAALTFVHELSSRTMKKEQLHAGTVEVFVGDGAERTFV
ncbi:MAG TPA: hypothetical protein QGI30_04540, partial [Anaerolineales bacterium]|nr:hypothetical protein [Anaerolineales bacterium]